MLGSLDKLLSAKLRQTSRVRCDKAKLSRDRFVKFKSLPSSLNSMRKSPTGLNACGWISEMMLLLNLRIVRLTMPVKTLSRNNLILLPSMLKKAMDKFENRPPGISTICCAFIFF